GLACFSAVKQAECVHIKVVTAEAQAVLTLKPFNG
ncbi:MAG: hypothetical protein ACI93P_002751, partial [bacterium]